MLLIAAFLWIIEFSVKITSNRKEKHLHLLKKAKRNVLSKSGVPFLSNNFHGYCPKLVVISLREKYPNTEFLLVRIFPHLDWIRRNTECLSVFSPIAGKYGPEKTPYLDSFHALYALLVLKSYVSKMLPPLFSFFLKVDIFLFLDKVWRKFETLRRILQSCFKKILVTF